MNKKLKAFVISLLSVCAISAMAQNVETKSVPGASAYKTEDSSYVMRIKYNGSDSTAAISNSAIGVVLRDGTGITTPIIIPTTASALLAAMEAATNSSGTKNFDVEYVNCLSGDTVSNNIITSSATWTSLADGQWHEVLKWDTSQCLHYDACSYGDNAPARWLTTIYGQPGGTGDLTLNVYLDGTEVYEKVITSPYYVFGQISTTTNTNTAINVVNVWENLGSATTYGIYAAPKQRVHVRATRATTGTTGSIGGLMTVR